MTPHPKLLRSPLVYALAVVRFSPIALMKSYVSEIQEAMRLNDFPQFSEENSHRIRFGPSGPMQRPIEEVRWIFKNNSGAKSAILTTNFFAFEVSEYDRFDSFESDVVELLSIVSEKSQMANNMLEQVGLRYLDAVVPVDALTAQECVQPSIRGLELDTLGIAPENGGFQYVVGGAVNDGQFRLAVYPFRNGIFMPADISATVSFEHLQFDKKTSGIVLDFDHTILSKGKSFSTELVKTQLKTAHSQIGQAFRSVVTTEAMEAWGES